MKMKKITKIFAIISLLLFLSSCCDDYQLGIHNGNSSQVFINDQPISELICDKSSSETDTLYFINLDNGTNRFKFIMNDGTVIDTTKIVYGEVYLGVDLENKSIWGF